jgi:hypothetical protein
MLSWFLDLALKLVPSVREETAQLGAQLQELVEARLQVEALQALARVLPGVFVEEGADLIKRLKAATEPDSEGGASVTRAEWESIGLAALARAKERIGRIADRIDEAAGIAIVAEFLGEEGFQPQPLAVAEPEPARRRR